MEFQRSFLDVNSWGNQWSHCKILAVFLVFLNPPLRHTVHSTANGTTSCWMSFNPSTKPCPSLQLLSSTETGSKEL